MLEESRVCPNDLSLSLENEEREGGARPLGENASVESRACMREASGRLACARLDLERGSRRENELRRGEKEKKKEEEEDEEQQQQQHQQQQHHHHRHEWRSEEGKVVGGGGLEKRRAGGRTNGRTREVQRTLPRPAYPHRACNCNCNSRGPSREEGESTEPFACTTTSTNTRATHNVRTLFLSSPPLFLFPRSKDRSTPTDIIRTTVRDDWVMSRVGVLIT